MTIQQLIAQAQRLGLTVTTPGADALSRRVSVADHFGGTVVSILYGEPGTFRLFLAERPVISVDISDDGGKSWREVAHGVSFERAATLLADAFAYLVETK